MRFPVLAALLAIAALGSPAAAPSAPSWSWPIAAPHRVVRGFVAPAGPYAAGHRGIDLATEPGEAVRAPADGTVVWAGRIADRGVLSIDHGAGVRSSFEPVTPAVGRGDHVLRGQLVARVATGGTHPPGVLHLGARRDGAYVSPLTFLGGLERAVLLPLDTVTTGDAPAGSSR